MRHTSWDSRFDGNEPGSKEGFVGNETTDSRIERRFEPENDPVDGDPNVPGPGIETPLGRIARWNRRDPGEVGRRGYECPGGGDPGVRTRRWKSGWRNPPSHISNTWWKRKSVDEKSDNTITCVQSSVTRPLRTAREPRHGPEKTAGTNRRPPHAEELGRTKSSLVLVANVHEQTNRNDLACETNPWEFRWKTEALVDGEAQTIQSLLPHRPSSSMRCPTW